MRRRELGRAVETVPALAAAVCLALCSCGQALRSTQPQAIGQSMVEGAGKAEKTTPPGKRKTDPPTAGAVASRPETARTILGQIPSIGEAGNPDAGALQPITADQMLDHAHHRYEVARKHWDDGQLTQAREETDVAFRLLMLVPSELEEQQSARRDEIQLGLSRLVVTMSAAHAGPVGGMSELPLVTNPYVEREIRLFQTSERHFFVDSFRRSGTYMPYILKKLEEQHMPAELAWLPLIESSFNPRALSSARALGLWQFIPSTGYRFGLQRDVWVDDRMDPEKATEAALAYLKELHHLFGDWSTAVAAYNCGEANVAKAIRRNRVEYLDSFWDLFPLLPYETARYVPRFMATIQIMKDPAKFGFDELDEPYAPWSFETVEISRQTDLRSIARLLAVDARALESLNPALRRGLTPPRPFTLRVPPGYAQILSAKLTEPAAVEVLAVAEKIAVRPRETPATGPTSYRVRSGDTLSSIARRFRVSVASLVRANSLMSQHRLDVGQMLSIPRRGI